MSAEENVALPLTLAGIDLEERSTRARHLLELVGLANRARTRVNRLSGGEQQKVAVARALADRPGLTLPAQPTRPPDPPAGDGVPRVLPGPHRPRPPAALGTP